MEATAKKPTPIGVIDLGSNSFRLLIGVSAEQSFTTLVKELRTVGLAKGLRESGTLSPDGMASGLEALACFRTQLDEYQVSSISCFGTEALRRSKNTREFIAAAESTLGCKIEILTGEQEAELSVSGVLYGLQESIRLPTFIVDVGGGSTEISYISQKGILLNSISLPAGAVPLTECEARYVLDTHALVRERIRDLLVEIPALANLQLVSTGGTATTIAMLDLELGFYDEKKVHGSFVPKSRLDILTDRLSALNSAERDSLPGLEAGRSKIIIAGCKIYQEIIATIGVEGMIVSDWGLLEGILLENIKH